MKPSYLCLWGFTGKGTPLSILQCLKSWFISFFALDHVNYSQWIPIHIHDMKSLPADVQNQKQNMGTGYWQNQELPFRDAEWLPQHCSTYTLLIQMLWSSSLRLLVWCYNRYELSYFISFFLLLIFNLFTKIVYVWCTEAYGYCQVPILSSPSHISTVSDNWEVHVHSSESR